MDSVFPPPPGILNNKVADYSEVTGGFSQSPRNISTAKPNLNLATFMDGVYIYTEQVNLTLNELIARVEALNQRISTLETKLGF